MVCFTKIMVTTEITWYRGTVSPTGQTRVGLQSKLHGGLAKSMTTIIPTCINDNV